MTGYVYSPTGNGHRTQYTRIFSDISGLVPLIEPMSVQTFWRLCWAKRLFLITFDDKIYIYAVLAVIRSILWKKTSTLTLRPHSCFEGKRLKAGAKRTVFRILKGLPNFSLLAAVPFDWRPEYKKICSGWIYDPQFWDLYYSNGKNLMEVKRTSLSADILSQAETRPIVMFLGRLSHDKGFAFFEEIASGAANRQSDLVFVAAGGVHADSKMAAKKFEALGGILIDRFITDEELESLYTISDLIWACYSPQYDQTSGVFGRAIQLSVPVCVRKGSFVSQIASKISALNLTLAYGEGRVGVDNMTAYLEDCKPGDPAYFSEAQLIRLENWTRHSNVIIRKSLGLENSAAEPLNT